MYTFGPINSRRFGKSLGVDLSQKLKQCNFDCLYCELDRATPVNKQSISSNYLDIYKDIENELQKYSDINYITFTANGEPTLYKDLDKLLTLVDLLKGNIKTLILTNSTMVVNKNVYNTLLKFDAVKFSLDSVIPKTFKKIDRPHKDVNLTKITEKMIEFSKDYDKDIFLEILVVKDINDKAEEFIALNKFIQKMNFTKIHLNSVDRPPSYDVASVSDETLVDLAQYLKTDEIVEFSFKDKREYNKESYSREKIINTVSKRPLKNIDIELLFDIPSRDILKNLIDDKTILYKDGFYILNY